MFERINKFDTSDTNVATKISMNGLKFDDEEKKAERD